MLLVKTNKVISSIHGEGIFAAESIKKGQPVWKFNPLTDLRIKQEDVIEDLREHFDNYGTITQGKDVFSGSNGPITVNYEDKFIYNYDGDDCKYMNHSTEPNVSFGEDLGLALQNIEMDEELTCDYRTITTEDHFNYLMSLSETPSDLVEDVEILEETLNKS